MSTIGAPSELAAYLRSQLASVQRPVAAQAPQPGSLKEAADQRRPTSADRSGEAHQSEDLATALIRRISVIDPQDPDRRRKAFRVFLESLMLQEWGQQLINDPGFYQLVEEVHTQMDSRPELRQLMDQASDALLGQVGGPSQDAADR